MDFLEHSPRYGQWFPLYSLAFMTGMRIGEVGALQWSDIDYESQTINIDKTLVYLPLKKGEQSEYYLNPPKTKSSIRKIPLTDRVVRILGIQREYLNKTCLRCNIAVHNHEGRSFSDFIFLNATGSPLNEIFVNNLTHRIVDYQNRLMDKRIKLGESPENCVYLKYFSSHIMRHSFACRAIENNMHPRLLMQMLGHASIKVSFDIYAEFLGDAAREEFQKHDMVWTDNGNAGNVLTNTFWQCLNMGNTPLFKDDV